MEALARRAGELGLTVLMDNANILPGDSEKLFNLVVRVPKTTFILAHIGGLNFRFWNILALARTADGFGFENLYFDISATVLVVPIRRWRKNSSGPCATSASTTSCWDRTTRRSA